MDSKIIAKIGVLLSKFVVYICDIIAWPVYTLIDRPWIHWRRKKIIWSKLEKEDDPYSCYVRQVHHSLTPATDGIKTLDELFRYSTARYAKNKFCGTRQVLGEEEIVTGSGKIHKKLNLGEYQWMTYEEVGRRVELISRGLLSIGVVSKKPVVILGETRVEWFMAAQACFRINVPVATLYATLGEDGIIHGINETEVSHVITTQDLLSKFKKSFKSLPNVTHVVLMDDLTSETTKDIPADVKVLPLSKLEELGQNNTDESYEPPTPEDLVVLMYTSGSTGVPKAVMISNKNAMASLCGFIDVFNYPTFGPDDMYIAYLPLAHIMELEIECYLSYMGIPMGYSTPQTLTDFSTAIKKGSKGDLTVLKPTIMAAVPLMLDRIRKSILQLAGPENGFSRGMFDYAVSYKKYWMHSGYKTPMIDRYLMKTYHDFVGGRLRILLSGSAPISPDTQDFIRCCLNVQVIQGYGMTETAASSCLMDFDDYSTGRVGAPLSTCKLRLVDWEEGQYYVTDKPHPRGEIVVGGDCVTKGYFKKEDLTKECFKEELGTRWFYTGDIGEIYPNGTVKIIDRKSDLLKLQFGEYVALGKIEAELKTCPLVENVCVVGRGVNAYLVALVSPNRSKLESMAKDMGKAGMSFEELCDDKAVARRFAEELREHGRKCRLFGSELPKKVKLCPEDWVPESGLVTAALKIRRKIIQKFYDKDIEEMYATHETNGAAVSPSS